MGECAGALVLFDIDGTLLRRSGPHHRQALVDAIRAITGLETTTEGIPLQGMLDRDIIAWMLRVAGVGAGEMRRLMPAVVRRAQWLYQRNAPDDLRDRVCPGVPRLLGDLRRRRVTRGLVTGNLSGIGWKKIERARLRQFFEFGAFAEAGRTRGELVGIALREARGLGFRKGHPVTLIGDHANDIQAARENGVRVIAVATGVMPLAELEQCKPDLALPDLTHLDAEYLMRRI